MGVGRGAGPHRRGLPRLGRARRLAGRGVPRRAELDAAAALLARVRAARAARLRARRALRPADRARRRRALRARGRRAVAGGGGGCDHRGGEAAARVRRQAAARAPRARPGRGRRGPARRARPRVRGLGHAGRPRRPGRRGARADPGGPVAPVSAQAVPAPPRPAVARARTGAPRRRLPMAVLLLACLGARRALAADGLDADLRPMGVDHLGPRDHAVGPRDHQRPVVEAAAGAVHDAVRAGRRRRRAGAVAGDRARGRAARVRDGLPPGRAARRPVGGPIAAVALVLSDEFIFNFARGNSEGMLVALVLWAVERPPRRPLQPRLPARLRRRAAAARGVAVLGPLRPLAAADRDRRTAALVFGCRAARARALVPARVPGLGRLAARRLARAGPQPRLGGLRRLAVRGGLRALGGDPVGADLRRRRDRRGARRGAGATASRWRSRPWPRS